MTSTTAAPAHTGRRLRIAGFSALGGLVVYVLLGLHFFVFPGQDPLPRHADVAIVLGPPTEQRVATADRLLARGVVGTVLISIPNDAPDPRSPNHFWIARCAAAADTICEIARPFTTQGEARMLESGAAEHGWTSAIAITQTAHLDRARTILGRCFSDPIAMRASGEQPAYGWAREYLYQTAATVKAWFVTPGC